MSTKTQTMVSFDVSQEDANMIREIATRAIASRIAAGSRMDLEMDIEAVHANGTPLRLAELLGADAFNFAHDVVGIQNRIDRNTGKLRDHFLPRYARGKQ